MQTKAVENLPQCTECVATDHNPINDATFQCLTPTKTTSLMCDEHFMNYVEQRLGVGTVKQLVMTQSAGRNKKNAG